MTFYETLNDMFTVDPNITDLKVRERSLFKVLFSMNVHQVANPEMGLEDARSYIFFISEGDRVRVYIGLYFVHSDRRMFYTHSSNPFPEPELAVIEDEARRFAEDLGAMLDEIDLGRLPEPEKNRWLEQQEIISGRKKKPQRREGAASTEMAPAPPASGTASSGPAPKFVKQQAAGPAGKSPGPDITPASNTPGFSSEVDFVQPPPVRPPQRMQGKAPEADAAPAGAKQTAEENGPAVRTGRSEDVFEQAVKAGVVKAPKAQLKKESRSAEGTVSREREALARLMASF